MGSAASTPRPEAGAFLSFAKQDKNASKAAPCKRFLFANATSRQCPKILTLRIAGAFLSYINSKYRDAFTIHVRQDQLHIELVIPINSKNLVSFLCSEPAPDCDSI